MSKKLTWVVFSAIVLGLVNLAFAKDFHEHRGEKSKRKSGDSLQVAESTTQPTAEVAGQVLTIDEATWEGGDHLLVAKGFARKRTSVVVKNGEDLTTIKQTVSNREGAWNIRVSMAKPPCTLQAVSNGEVATKAVANASAYCGSSTDNGGGGTDNGGGSGGGTTPAGNYVALANNDLGMHCADLDYRVFSILPPYNVVHSQVIKKGSEPQIMDHTQVDLYYKASPNPADSLLPGAITTTSTNYGGFKTNFWEPDSANAQGRIDYDPLYPPGVLDSFNLPRDTGLPAPEVERLYLGDGVLAANQQKMPGVNNLQQPFLGYIKDFPFFVNPAFKDFPSLFYTAFDLQRFTAEGIPIVPVADPDASGNLYESAYPLMQVTAVAKGADPAQPANQLASVRTVLPVASEADCQLCHVDQDICAQSATTAGQACFDQGSNPNYHPITTADLASVPGDTNDQLVLNAAKINILRLHDAKHGTKLDEKRNIVCATCHYSPALDLAHLGPNDTNGKEQTQHVSMSNAMHGYHGQFGDLFPDMPAPGNRNLATAQDVLEQTCYACHPGKRTQCLRGAMAGAGVVCQDCHGNMSQVGNDFTAQLKQTGSFDPTRRVPWASEPGCQSCHTGDAVSNLAGDPSTIAASDGIRLLQAYRTGDATATPIKASNRRFAETQETDSAGNPKDHLYRLSKGHGGVMCEGCHGSTHAIWPNPRDAANDNLTAKDLQGHSGVVAECSVCHGNATLGNNLNGPHGMHPVGSSNWNQGHESVAERNSGQCKSCHGNNGEGTVLSRTSAQRQWTCASSSGSLCSREGQQITVAKGTEVSCTQCHSNKINGD